MEEFNFYKDIETYITHITMSVKRWDMFDRDFPNEKSLIAALYSGDLRGRFGNDSAYHLFITYFSENRLEELRSYFPQYIELRNSKLSPTSY